MLTTKMKLRQFKYDGCFNKGDNVIVTHPYLPRKFDAVTLTEKNIGVITGKEHLYSVGSTQLGANEGHWEYTVQFQDLGIELWGLPEWLIERR